MSRFRSLPGNEAGASAVEFGLLLLPLLATVMGFGDLAYQSYVRANLQATLNDVARSAVVENPTLGGTGSLEQKIEREVIRRMEPLVTGGTYSLDIQNFKNFAAINKPEALVTDKNANGRYDSGDCWEDSNPNGRFDASGGRAGVGGADEVVVYDVKLTAPHLFPVMAVIEAADTFETQASTLVRTQPYANQRQAGVVC